jgi:hypothetical protein
MSGELLPRGEPVDFDVVAEHWSVYRVKDKSPVILKARIVLTKAIRTTETNELGEPVYATGTGNIILVTFAPPEIRGPPTIPLPSNEQIAKSLLGDLGFDTIEEPWNEYKLKDDTIVRMKVVLTGVTKTPFFSADGDPLYYVNHQRVGRIIVSPELRKSKSNVNLGKTGNGRIA